MKSDIKLDDNNLELIGNIVVFKDISGKVKIKVQGPNLTLGDHNSNATASIRVQDNRGSVSIQSGIISGIKVVSNEISAGEIHLGPVASDSPRPSKLSMNNNQGTESILLDGKTGNITISGNVINLSDARCKTEIEDLTTGLEDILQLRGVKFHWNDKKNRDPHNEKQLGLIAQEVEEVIPSAVSKDAQGRAAVSYTSLIPAIVEGIKSQQKMIQSQIEENHVLRQRLERIETQMASKLK